MKNTTSDTSPREMLEQVSRAREIVGGENNTREIIDQSLEILHDTVVNMYLEKCGLSQHEMMTERDKNTGDENKIRKAVQEWRKTIREVEKYVKLFKLIRWQSRIDRYWGRLCDATGKYSKAINYYKKSIRTARLDPEFVDRGIPRWLEVEGFLASAYLLSGQIKKGWEASKKIYEKFDVNEGAELKEKDYSTWAIWKSGVPIRIGLTMRTKKFQIDLNEYKKWLEKAEKLLYPPPEVKVWVDFGFRKNEIEAIRRELKIQLADV